MDHLSALPPLSWSQQLRSQMQSRPLTALGLFIALVAVLLLLLQSLIMLATGDVTSGVRYGLIPIGLNIRSVLSNLGYKVTSPAPHRQ